MNKQRSLFDVDVTEAFDYGKLVGAIEVLEELYELSSLDVNFQKYIQKKLDSTKSFLKTLNIQHNRH